MVVAAAVVVVVVVVVVAVFVAVVVVVVVVCLSALDNVKNETSLRDFLIFLKLTAILRAFLNFRS